MENGATLSRRVLIYNELLFSFTPSSGSRWHLQKVGQPGEVIWQVQHAGSNLYTTSYIGKTYQFELPADINLHFNKSSDTDGASWEPVNLDQEIIYNGGISELGWSFDIYKNAWGIGRNEHGDLSGWGSRIFKADHDPDATGSHGPALKEWNPLHEESDPNIYESPRLFRHGNDLYLIARTDPGGPFCRPCDREDPNVCHLADLAAFTLRRYKSYGINHTVLITIKSWNWSLEIESK